MAPDTLVQTLPVLPSRRLPRPLASPTPPTRVLEVKASAPKPPPEEDAFLLGLHKPPRKPAAQSATHELRALRAQSAALETQLATLCRRWQQTLPDPATLTQACEAAKAKWISTQAEALNRSLKDQMLHQQLNLASLQHLITQSPLLAPSRSKEIFEGMHSFSSLMALSPQRLERLQTQCDVGLRLVPALMGRFAYQHLPRVSPSSPFSHTSIMADGNYTYVSNILLCRIPNRPLDAVTGAALRYFQDLSTELRTHLGVQCDLEPMQDLGNGRAYTKLRYRNGRQFAATINSTLAAKFEKDAVVIVADFVDQDELHPIDRTEVGMNSCLSLMMTLEIDPVTRQHEVLVQRLAANRYNLPPTSPRLHDEIRSALPWLNGDLFMEVVCRELERAGSPKALQGE